MPTYDYACAHCSHTFEAFQSMRDDPLKTCPQCGKPRLKRLVGSGAGLIFKGSGFYTTDYKKPGAGKKEAGGEGKSGESKSSDGKPAEKKSSSDSKPASDSKSTSRPSSPKE